MRNRRKFLLSAGALAAVSTVGTANASSQNEARTEEVNREFLTGVADNGAEGAKQALKEIGLEPTVKAVKVGNQDEQQVSPQDAYGDPEDTDSALVVSVSPAIGSDPEVWMSASMRLEDPEITARSSSWCPDAIGIGFNNNDWADMGEPDVRVTHDHTAKYTAEDVDDDALAGTIDLTDHSDYSDAPSEKLPDAIAGLTGKFRLRDDGEPTSLWGSYTHTYSPTPGGVIEGISGGKGGISVDLNLRSAKAWSIAHPADPEDELS